jgi:hypothetical protein
MVEAQAKSESEDARKCLHSSFALDDLVAADLLSPERSDGGMANLLF